MDFVSCTPDSIVTAEGERQTFWRVLVNDGELSVNVPPFAASNETILLRECLNCGRCKASDVSVRREGKFVFWFAKHVRNCGITPMLAPETIFTFDAEAYESVIGDGDTSQIPRFSARDIGRVLKAQTLPDLQTGRYRIPNWPDDPRGLQSLQHIRDALETIDPTIRIVEPPEQWATLRIGLETAEVPGPAWHIAQVGEQLAVRFEASPTFPLWVTGAQLSGCLGPYVAGRLELPGAATASIPNDS